MPTSNVIIDLSHNNANASLQQARAAGIVGVIHKATQGTSFVDPMYAARRQAAADAGLLWGAYHFGTGADPATQAKFFLRVASPAPQDLIVLDFETNRSSPANTMSLDQARDYIAAVRDAKQITPGLYGGSLLRDQLGVAVDSALQACWLWWAQYGPAPLIPTTWSTWTLWQYTDGHHGLPPLQVDGVGRCDRDQYQGTADDLQARWVTGTLV